MKKSCFCVLAAVLLASMAKADTTMTYSGNLPTTQTVLFQNASLLAVKGLSLDGYQKFGGFTDTRTYTIYEGEESTGAPSSGYYKNSSLFGYANSGTTLTVEFHGHNSYGYNGIGNGFELKLTQSGNDILGQVTWMAGFTGANDYENLSWESKKKSNFNDWNSSSATYSTCGSNLTLVFRETESHTVTFVDWNGTILDTQTVAFGADATAPANPSRSGYVFAGWDTAFTAVTENLTVTAIYHKLFTVTFRDADGTVLDTQTVEETTAATAPDMTGRTYGGNPFSGWDVGFENVTGDLVVTAVYGAIPEAVTIAVDTGLLAYEENILIWTEAEGTWNAGSVNWCTADGVRSAWQSGATAVFPVSAEVTVEGTPQASRIYLLGEAETVTFKGEGAATVSVGGTVCFGCDASVVVEGTLALGDGVTVLRRDRHDTEGKEDVLPTDMSVVVKGNLDMGASMAVSDGVVLKTAGEGLLESGVVTGEITLSGDAVLDLAGTAAQTMNGKIAVSAVGHGHVITRPGSNVSFTSSKSASWELRVAGDSYVSGYDTLPNAVTVSGRKIGQTHVLDGGTLRMGEANGYWGPQVWSDEGIYVEKGGAVRLLSNKSLGAIMGVCVNGGSVTNESANIDCLLYKWQLNDGAVLTGKPMRVGFISYYETWSYVAAGGTSPSKVGLDEIQIGYQTPAANKKYVGIDFRVADVTDDADTDLLVTSPITERAGVALFSEGFRENLGVWKQGAGTLELAADSTSCATGVFKIEAGTVRFPDAAAGDFGALVVLGDSEIEVARSARITFDASSDMAWTADKTLVFSGTMGKKSVRVGTSAAALTADQLAAVKFKTASGKLRAMTVDAEGYLVPPAAGMSVYLR